MVPMKKVLFLSTHDKDGGATAWFINLARTLHQSGYEVEMVVKYKHTDASFVYKIPPAPKKNKWQCLVNLLTGKKDKRDVFFESNPNYAFFPSETEMSAVAPVEHIARTCRFVPEVIISGLVYGLANTETLRQLHELWNVPVYMTAFDANVYTGGCHVLWECEKYRKDCADCPGVGSVERRKEIANSFAIKLKNIKAADIGVMYASPWSLHNASQSACFKDGRKFDIGMCIDTNLFSNKNRSVAKQIFDIPCDAKVIFTGSSDVCDKRKGVNYFFESLSDLWESLDASLRERVYVLIAGHKVEALRKQVSELPRFHYACIDFISDTRLLSLAYQASDVFVCPSIEDAGPMMVAESLSCGTPVVGFPVGLMFDQSYVKNGVTGYVVKAKSKEKLSEAISKIIMLEDEKYSKMSLACRDVAEKSLSQLKFVNDFGQFAKCLGK